MLKKNGLFIFLLLISLIFQMGGEEAKQRKANFFGKFVFYPFIKSLNSMYEIFEIKEENILLSEALAIKQLEVVKLKNTLSYQEYITAQFEVEQTEFILSNIIAYTGNFQEKTLIIDKGTRDGLKRDFPVISTNGIVGKITTVTQNYAIVLPYNHSGFRLGVMLKRNSLQGLLKSDIYGNIAMTMLREGADINVGDTLITSDISNIFPQGFPIGIIDNIQNDNNNTNMKAKILPFEEIEQLDKVIIIKYKKDMSYEKEIDKNR